ncbi:MAG: spermidine/putrescine ABC transporter substrate-binding protein, partial [candidate division Zixibacteria bacterium]|nr:spermidine/putrescine ABC transporter substrate-binding protein [Gammaproteobacteria bacterium]NIX56621.1 spermidine/putrescine ABC transporter substrate-binding protein [candidate division Zixibacteria bacterium]
MKKSNWLLLLTSILIVSLAACGGSAEENQLAEELHIYNWSEYIDPEVYEAFEAEYGVRVIEDTFSSNEELLAKLQ